MRNKIKKEGGFSLMEMMVVVIIIGIIAVISVPLYSGFTAKAHLVQIDIDYETTKKVFRTYLFLRPSWPIVGHVRLNSDDFATNTGLSVNGGVPIIGLPADRDDMTYGYCANGDNFCFHIYTKRNNGSDQMLLDFSTYSNGSLELSVNKDHPWGQTLYNILKSRYGSGTTINFFNYG